MKFVRFSDENKNTYFGIVNNDSVIQLEGSIFENYSTTNNSFDLNRVKILPPCNPTKILAVGLNYKDHAEEMKKTPPTDPMLFLKPSTAVIAHMEDIVYPKHMSERVDYEGELAVVIGKEAHMVSKAEAMQYVFGYTCINDITARDLQAKDIQFTRGKGFNTFAPIGPFIENEINPANLNIRSYLNGEKRQDSNTSNLIFKIPKLINFISSVMTLFPGDIIATGTPAGIGPMQPGDKVEVEIEGIGKLINNII